MSLHQTHQLWNQTRVQHQHFWTALTGAGSANQVTMQYAFLVSMHCWQVFEEIKTNETLKVQFLGAGNQRSPFVQIMDRVSDSQFAADNYCLKGHSLKSFIVHRLFNCFAKNLVKELSAEASGAGQNCHQLLKKRKIAKLTGETRC